MRLAAAISGTLKETLARDVRAGERAVTAAVNEAALALKTDYRGQVTRAGMGARLAGAWRSQTYPKGGQSLQAAGLVWTRASTIIDAHSENRTITARNGRFLAIPLPAAGKGPKGTRITPAQFEARSGTRLRFIPRPGAGGLLVAEGARLTSRGVARANIRRSKGVAYTSLKGATSVPVFILVRQTSLRKVFDIDGPAQQRLAQIPDDVIAKWDASDG